LIPVFRSDLSHGVARQPYLSISYLYPMVRPKTPKCFSKSVFGAHYWVIFDNGVHIGVVAPGSKANYYFTDANGVVTDEGFNSTNKALAACLALRKNSHAFMSNINS
jgi:hypothetical protein